MRVLIPCQVVLAKPLIQIASMGDVVSRALTTKNQCISVER